MARIRTIKPEFFTSDDVCALSPLARILYIGLWCEADRDGRLVWLPKALKRRYLPDDECEIESICRELLGRDLVRLYGEGLAFIPTFLQHQHPNPREKLSTLPVPDCDGANLDLTRANPDRHAQVGREGEGRGREGREGEGASPTTPAARATMSTYLSDDWAPDVEDLAWAKKARPDMDAAALDAETERFRNHAKANNRTAFTWGPNWRIWISKAHAAAAPRQTFQEQREAKAAGVTDRDGLGQWRQRVKGWKPGVAWWQRGDWGPEPYEPGCRVPATVLAEIRQ